MRFEANMTMTHRKLCSWGVESFGEPGLFTETIETPGVHDESDCSIRELK